MYADKLSPSDFAADRARVSCCLSIAMLILVVGIERIYLGSRKLLPQSLRQVRQIPITRGAPLAGLRARWTTVVPVKPGRVVAIRIIV